MRHTLAAVLLVCSVGGLDSSNSLAAQPRYVATWLDGTQTTDEEVQDWGRTDSKPTLAGRPLFDPGNAIRTLEDTTLSRGEPPTAYVEFYGGDRLPGRVVEFVAEGQAAGVPAHLIVEASVDLGLPKVFSRKQVRVLPDWVQRIVRRPSVGPTLPAKTVQVGGGSRESFRGLRWRAEGVQVLTEAGLKPISFAQIGELNLGPWRSWQAWQRQLAVLTPGLDSRLMRVDLPDGVRLTTSLERLKPRSQNGDDPHAWYQLIQPAWSLDLLAVPHRKIRRRTFFSPQETPLSVIEPKASRHRAIFSQAWGEARIDRNVSGAPLHADRREFGWGFGVHASHELEFELPASAKKFQSKMALDRAAGAAGGATGRILIGEQKLFESGLLIGAGPAIAAGPISISGRPTSLRLLVDAASAAHPKKIAPLDICAVFNWLEPIVEHDLAELRGEIDRERVAALPLLAGWDADAIEAGNWRVVNRFDETDLASPCFRELLVLEGPLTLSRLIPHQGRGETASLCFGRPGGSTDLAKFEVWVNGRRVAREALPGANASPELLRVEVPLKSTSDTVELTLRLDPGGKPALVDWRGISLSGAN